MGAGSKMSTMEILVPWARRSFTQARFMSPAPPVMTLFDISALRSRCCGYGIRDI